MINSGEILETIKMISEEHLDIRTVTMGISLLDCADESMSSLCTKVYDKITKSAQGLVAVAEKIEARYGIPIINKRISVTPAAIVAAAARDAKSYASLARAMDKAASATGVNFIGGFSALAHKGATKSDNILIRSIPEALASTERVCSSVNVGTTKAGINMDIVRTMGEIVKKTAALTADADGFGCAKLVVFANAVEDNPFMAGAFHGVGEPETGISVGVSGPGAVKSALERARC